MDQDLAILAGLSTLILIPAILISIFLIICNWKIFTKAGKPGWACLIPIYNTLVTLEIIGKPWWWLFLLMIPFVNIIFIIWATNLLSLSFGKEEGFTIGLILLPIVFLPILAFGSPQYRGPAGNLGQAKNSEAN